MNACLCGFLMIWFVNLIGKLMIMPYQKGWIQLPGNNPTKTFAYLYTSSISKMVVINSFWNCPFLFIGMFLTTYYISCSISCLVLLTFERSCATYLLNDYETKKRPQIFILVLLSQHFGGFLATCLTCTMIVPVEFWLGLIIFILIITFLGYGYIWYWNVRKHRILDSHYRFSRTKYSLQARFQAKENIRSLSFTKFVFTFATIGIFLEAVFLCIQSEDFGKLGVIVLYVIELANAVNPIAIVPLIFIKVPSWRKKFFGDCKMNPPVKWLNMKLAKTSPEVTFVKNRSNSQLETEEYFKQLQKAWT